VIAAEISLVLTLMLGLLVVDPLVAVFSLLFFGLLVGLLQVFLGPWATRLGRAQAQADIGSVEAMQHALRAYREVTVTGRRSLFIAKFQALRWDAAKVLADQFVLSQIGKYVFEIGLIIGGGLLVSIVLVTKDLTAAIGIITVFLAASARLFPSLLRMQAALSNIRSSEGTASVTFDLIADLSKAEELYAPPSIPPALAEEFTRSVHEGFPGFIPSVELFDVSLGYPGASQLALDSISLRISPSQSVAFVGSTGAGKSTLADVILGVLLPDSGSVLISGRQPFESVQRWPGAMSYVPQEVAVLTGSVRENVALGIPSEFIDNSLVWEALERAHLAEFLRSSRDGIETLVGENGVQLSGGQRQRLGIARALYSRPRLLVLDEATSALDAETERLITETLDSLAGDVTLIIIAHRLATVRHCDQVIYLADGRITGSGTFSEVRTQVPDFDRQAELLGL
jgi:ABC-type multidrug transport system fused ATPase/permease subunit